MCGRLDGTGGTFTDRLGVGVGMQTMQYEQYFQYQTVPADDVVQGKHALWVTNNYAPLNGFNNLSITPSLITINGNSIGGQPCN
jgi:hypothetical protein